MTGAAVTLAHGVGGRGDLPIPAWTAGWSGAVVLAVSFAVLGMSWRRPRLRALAAGRALPGLGAPAAVAGWVLRLAVLALAVVVVTAGFVGRDTTTANLAPVTVYVMLWVGVPLTSALLGPWWRAVSPFETVGRMVDGVRRRTPAEAPGWLSSGWVALVPISGFHWLELAYHDGASPRVLGWWALLYTSGLVVLAWRFGWASARKAECFGVLFDMVAAMAPVHREADGRWRLRAPFVGVADLDTSPAQVAVLLAAVGGTAFDGVSRTSWWGDLAVGRTGWDLTVFRSVGLVWVAMVVGVAFHFAGRMGGRLTGDTGFATRFGASLVPILIGYDLAHYFSLLLLEGQGFRARLSDPYGRGWDLFGTVTDPIDWTLVSTTTVGWIQIGAIVGGHLVAVVVAHDRSVELWKPATALRSQYTMLAVMAAYTVAGLVLLTG